MNHKLIVIDTNILISAALSPDGTARKVLDKAYKQFKIAQSDETYQELKTRIYKSKFDKYISDTDRQSFLDVVKKYSQFIEIKSQINTCRDSDDNKFLELAKDSNAEFLFMTSTWHIASEVMY
jgi:uncharacterized protein